MRDLDLAHAVTLDPEQQLCIADPFRLRHCIIAYLAWPENPAERDTYLRVCATQDLSLRLAQIKDGETLLRNQLCPSDDDGAARLASVLNSVKGRLVVSALPDVGDFGAVADVALHNDALETELKREMLRASLAGHRLLYTAMMAVHHADRLRGGASLGKATALLAHHRESHGQAKTENPVDDAWKSHKHIAHLAAAVVLYDRWLDTNVALPTLAPDAADEVVAEQDRAFRGNLEAVMIVSQSFLEFGLSFAADRSPQACLDKDLAYQWPVACGSRRIEELVPPLTEDDLAFLDRHFTDPGKT
jgi:hypothetical protein